MRFHLGILLSKHVDWRERWRIPLPFIAQRVYAGRDLGLPVVGPTSSSYLGLASVMGDVRPPGALQSIVATLGFMSEVSLMF